MVRISYVGLIYRSVSWLKFVHQQLLKYTDMTDNEYYFIANDATPNVIAYLKDNNIPHYIHNNTDEQRKEWYINNVYRAWNTGARHARGEYIIFFNSDMAFTPHWADKLLSSVTETTCVNSRLVEQGYFRSGRYGLEKNFGTSFENYQEQAFIDYAANISVNEIHPGGLFMPMIIKKEHLEKVNYYPEGNIKPGCDIYNPQYAKIGEPCIPGDKVLMEKLKGINVHHVTNFSSIVYHFQAGEMRFE